MGKEYTGQYRKAHSYLQNETEWSNRHHWTFYFGLPLIANPIRAFGGWLRDKTKSAWYALFEDEAYQPERVGEREEVSYNLAKLMNRVELGNTLNFTLKGLKKDLGATEMADHSLPVGASVDADATDKTQHLAWSNFFHNTMSLAAEQYKLEYAKKLDIALTQSGIPFNPGATAEVKEQALKDAINDLDSAQTKAKEAQPFFWFSADDSDAYNQAADEIHERAEKLRAFAKRQEELQSYFKAAKHNIEQLAKQLNELAEVNGIQLRLRNTLLSKKKDLLNKHGVEGAHAINPFYLVDTSPGAYNKQRDLELRGLTEEEYSDEINSKNSWTFSRANSLFSQKLFSYAVSALVGIGEGLIAAMFVTGLPVMTAVLIVGVPGAIINYMLFKNSAIETLKALFVKEPIVVRDENGDAVMVDSGEVDRDGNPIMKPEVKWVRGIFLTKNEDGDFVEISDGQKWVLGIVGGALSAATAGIYAVMAHAAAVSALPAIASLVPFLAGAFFPPLLAAVIAVAMTTLFTYTVIKFVRDGEYKAWGDFFKDNFFGNKSTWKSKLWAGSVLLVLVPLLVVANLITGGILYNQSLQLMNAAMAASLTGLATPINALFYTLATSDGVKLINNFLSWLGSHSLRPIRWILDKLGYEKDHNDNGWFSSFIYNNAWAPTPDAENVPQDYFEKGEGARFAEPKAATAPEDGAETNTAAEHGGWITKAQQAEILEADHEQESPSLIKNIFKWENRVNLAVMSGLLVPNAVGNGLGAMKPEPQLLTSGVVNGLTGTQLPAATLTTISQNGGVAISTLSSAGACQPPCSGATVDHPDHASIRPHASLAEAVYSMNVKAKAAGDVSKGLLGHLGAGAAGLTAPTVQRPGHKGLNGAASGDGLDGGLSPRTDSSHSATAGDNLIVLARDAKKEQSLPPSAAATGSEQHQVPVANEVQVLRDSHASSRGGSPLRAGVL